MTSGMRLTTVTGIHPRSKALIPAKEQEECPSITGGDTHCTGPARLLNPCAQSKSVQYSFVVSHITTVFNYKSIPCKLLNIKCSSKHSFLKVVRTF